MRTFFIGSAVLLLYCASVHAQGVITVTDNLVVENIPALSTAYVDEVKVYTEARAAGISSWHPLRKEMIISTRFGNSSQLHYVRMPMGARTQLTFFDEPVTSASFDPQRGDFFIFSKDKGGNEFSQLYRYDVASKKVTLLTDGKRSQNGGVQWSNSGGMFAYTSTRRNGTDRDIHLIDPRNPASDKLLFENAGGGWSIAGWSKDDTQLLIGEGISINESRIYIGNVSSGVKTLLLPRQPERTNYTPVGFSADNTGIYLVTNKESEFNRLAYYEIAAGKLTYLTASIPWDVDGATLSYDKKKLAFVTNENGLSKLYIMETTGNSFSAVPEVKTGVISGVKWSRDSRSIGFSFSTYDSPADVFEYDTDTRQLIAWTESELGMMDPSALTEPQLISWPTFDKRNISGYLYRASEKFKGKRPVIIVIHGGPEGQAKPNFIGRSNYYLNEFGISLIYPNVRGSSGYGKTFLDLDNGMKREESVKDIGALLDWIATQPDLDANRVMVTGGSYGGYMTLAVSYLFSDKIRCAVDIVGISNFNTFMKNTESYRRDLRRVEYGDERDPEMSAFFEKIAPLNNVDKIKKPLFIVQGGNDPRVPYTEAIQMKERIIKNGGTVWFLMARDEGHGFRKKGNQDFEFYATLEFVRRFLLDGHPSEKTAGGK